MSKLSLRLRITLTTGVIVFIVSIISMFISTYFAQEAINDTVLVTNDYYFNSIEKEEGSLLSSELSFEKEAKKIMLDDEFADSQGTMVTIYYMDEQNVDYIKQNFQMIEFLISLFASIVAMLLVYYFSSKMLAPLKEVSDTMLTVSQNNLNQEIKGHEIDDEIGNLTFAFNKMTKRLDDQFKRQKLFSSNVAHELKTPLTIMKMSYQLLDDDTTLDEYNQCKALNERHVDNLVKICDDLLSFANDETIKVKEVVNLDNILDIVTDDLDVLIKERKINVVKDIDDTIAVLGNKRLIYQLFHNLINNAIKYNYDNGSIYIVVNKEKENIVIMIADSGQGMEKETVERIFEPFYRENKSRSRKTGGSGLGMAIVKQIVDLHHWKIDVESIKGQKSIFTITI
jgi:signal transduction histidine kinase